jgi:hypothetical protein
MSRLLRTALPGGLPGTGRGRCLGAELTSYADRAMDPATLLHWDRHLVSCACCRGAVAEERRVLASLRAPEVQPVPGDLRGMLLALASDPEAWGSCDRDGTRPNHPTSLRSHGVPVPPVPVAPVRVVDRGTPAMHRSARRATVFAGLAAGATAAAAWSLVVTGTAPVGPQPGSSPALVQRTRPASQGSVAASFTVGGLAAAPVASSTTSVRPAVSTVRGRPAQSTP